MDELTALVISLRPRGIEAAAIPAFVRLADAVAELRATAPVAEVEPAPEPEAAPLPSAEEIAEAIQRIQEERNA